MNSLYEVYFENIRSILVKQTKYNQGKSKQLCFPFYWYGKTSVFILKTEIEHYTLSKCIKRQQSKSY